MMVLVFLITDFALGERLDSYSRLYMQGNRCYQHVIYMESAMEMLPGKSVAPLACSL